MTAPLPTLVLLPGLLCDDDVWAEQHDALVDSCHVVIGRYGRLDQIEAMARHVLETVKAPRFALAGHSMGGRVALEVVRQAPERVQGLALLDTGTAALAPGQAGEEERRGRLALLTLAEREGMATMARQWAQPMVHPDVLRGPLFERIVAMIARSDTTDFAAQIRALLHRPDAEPTLRELRCPVLLLCGLQDRWSPPDRHRAMQALLPSATLRLIERCGHMSPMEQPDAVSAALVQWLESCVNGR